MMWRKNKSREKNVKNCWEDCYVFPQKIHLWTTFKNHWGKQEAEDFIWKAWLSSLTRVQSGLGWRKRLSAKIERKNLFHHWHFLNFQSFFDPLCIIEKWERLSVHIHKICTYAHISISQCSQVQKIDFFNHISKRYIFTIWDFLLIIFISESYHQLKHS